MLLTNRRIRGELGELGTLLSVGPFTLQRVRKAGISTIADLRRALYVDPNGVANLARFDVDQAELASLRRAVPPTEGV